MTKWIAVIGLTLFLNPNACLAFDLNSILQKAPSLESFIIVKATSGICPQNRKTQTGPSKYLKKTNWAEPTKKSIEKGKNLFLKNAKPTACKLCRGLRGNGNEHLAKRMEPPPPRNFTCGKVMEGLPDGQLFWVIQIGSNGTAMPAHRFSLSKEQIWKFILYIQKFLET
jgi:hypothetical protein